MELRREATVEVVRPGGGHAGQSQGGREEAGGHDLDGRGLIRTAGKGGLTGHDLCREEVGGGQSCRFFYFVYVRVCHSLNQTF